MKKKFKILIHLVFWFYMINQFLFPWYINKTEPHFWEGFGMDIFLTLINFYLFYFALHFLIRKKNLYLGILSGAFLVFFIAVGRYYAEVLFWKNLMHTPQKEMYDLSIWFYSGLRLSIITGAYAILLKFAIDWFDAQKLKAEMVNQKQTSELALLRSQVNPHFLFNTLNNIYSLVCKHSPEAPEAIMKLSSIMRYVLYDANTDRVFLEKEIEYLQSFIELQKLRIRNPDFVELVIEGDIGHQTIAPMLLIPFVENAFKHGSKTGALPGIRIRLACKSSEIVFEVTNHLKKNTLGPKDTVGGIGLQNITRRLKILYPGKYSLDTRQDDELYSVKLIIQN
ncbi:MAG: sensor histidine kinase [Bacteroidetes bacterium]|nr:sensor histidine kinase [Bacteroidota bacterium]